jgi:hypothetical protein
VVDSVSTMAGIPNADGGDEGAKLLIRVLASEEDEFGFGGVKL